MTVFSAISRNALRTGSFSSSFDIDLSHLPPGIYMVEAFSSSDVVVQEKVIKMEGR